MKARAFVIAMMLLLTAAIGARAEVVREKINEENFITYVRNEAWQPEGFDAALILRATFVDRAPGIDGLADDAAWTAAQSLAVPLSYGAVREAALKAVYTKEEVFLLVSWADPTKDDQHHPWVWDAQAQRYVDGPQVEDSLLVSFEAGCEWTPSLLSGYVFDFDGWRWLAARTDPLGQAVDVGGHVQDRWMDNQGYTKYSSRNKQPFWNLKFGRKTGKSDEPILTASWEELERWYLLQPVATELYVSWEPDHVRSSSPVFAEELPPPEVGPDEVVGRAALLVADPALAVRVAPALEAPRYRPVTLTGDAGEVAAKGRWAEGRWTVEFRRTLVTPARTTTDTIFNRVTQFSIHVFDHAERVDECNESGRLILEFEPTGHAETK